MTATPTKNIRFDLLTLGSLFASADLSPGTIFKKTGTRKARIFNDSAPDFAMKPSAIVQVSDLEKIKELARPVYDGTPASCKTENDYYQLHGVFTDVRQAYETLASEAENVRRKAAEVQTRLQRIFTFNTEEKHRGTAIVNATPAQLAGYVGVNSLGELQGRALDFDRQCALVHEKRNHALHVLRLLGYRLPTEEVQL